MRQNERRLTPRRKIKVPLIVQPLDGRKGPPQMVDSINISARGVCFVSRVSFEPGDSLQISLHMPERISKRPPEEWKCLARVVFARPLRGETGGIGIGATFLYYERVSKASDEKQDSISRAESNHSDHVKATDPFRRLLEIERRRFPRIELRSKIQITSGDADIEGETIDVSLEGLLARADRILAPGTRVRVKVSVPSSPDSIVRLGNIVWADGKEQMGIKLDQLGVGGRQLEELFLGLGQMPQSEIARG